MKLTPGLDGDRVDVPLKLVLSETTIPQIVTVPAYKNRLGSVSGAIRIFDIRKQSDETVNLVSIDSDCSDSTGPGMCTVQVSKVWFDFHKPEPGGFLVFRPDGYQSYRNADRFNEDYSRLNPPKNKEILCASK